MFPVYLRIILGDTYEQYQNKEFELEANTSMPGSTIWQTGSSFPKNKQHKIIYPSNHMLKPTRLDWQSWEKSLSTWYIPKGFCPEKVKIWGKIRLGKESDFYFENYKIQGMVLF